MWGRGLAIVVLLGGCSLFRVASGEKPKTTRDQHYLPPPFFFLDCIIVPIPEALVFSEGFLYLSLTWKYRKMQGKKSLTSLADSIC